MKATFVYRATAKECLQFVRPGAEIGAGKTESWSHSLLIPPIPPILIHIKITHITYELRFEVTPSGLSTDLDVVTPIIVGTIPMRQSFQHLQGANQPQGVPQNPALAQYPNMRKYYE